MSQVSSVCENGILKLTLIGKIDTTTANGVEKDIDAAREAAGEYSEVVVDMQDVTYVSSSGLRVILRLRKSEENLKLVNVTSEVYEVLEMTGFAEMIPVEKALRRLSIDGCDVIGKGAKGTVYRLNQDTIIKVYQEGTRREEIDNERNLARKAFVLGVPTAISFDVVRVGDKLGVVFELLNAKALSELMAESDEMFDKYAKIYTDLLKQIHEIEVDEEVRDVKPLIESWLDTARVVLEDEEYNQIKKIIDAVPVSNTLLHCDYHTNNVMVQDGELLLIDMDTLSRGNPIFDLANVFATYVGFGEVNPAIVEKFIHLPYDKACKVWEDFIPEYMGDVGEEEIKRVKDAAELLGYLRVLRHNIRRGALENDVEKEKVEVALSNLRKILSNVNSVAV